MSAIIEEIASSKFVVGLNGSLVDIQRHERIRVTGFGRLYYGEEVDWSFRPFQQEGDGTKEVPIARLLPNVAKSLAIKKILAPKPVFGTNIAFSTLCTVPVLFSHKGSRVTLMRGVSADVCFLSKGETFGITVGGCPIGWMYDPDTEGLVVAHMGLECLIDKNRLFGKGARLHESVVHTMVQTIALQGENTSNLQAGYAFPIAADDYTHEWDNAIYGEKNQLLCEYLVREFGTASVLGWKDATKRRQGRISLAAIICKQFADEGIPPEHIKGFTAPSGCDLEGKPLWYDTRGPFGPDARNLVLVTAL
jgi:hypothetical protein